ncbi:translation initiation factor IF-3 [Candidatus Carsonella ruddii]|uniref:Translation initiation factor IF-3 n=1 Tax=Candidatus Carsonella ruddii HC isolate Thao2000 TaxID=1202538 RepID=J3YQ33_CARRU|nr:translation initiation factor IF-3 [Candidatus Carsonella ruddii]AFP83958.1 translation initiation factor IF-3 [Candidatus Carsonella ruddii HC isolate Thao2000]
MFKKILLKKNFFLEIKILTFTFFFINNFFFIFKKNKKKFFFYFNLNKKNFFFIFKIKKRIKKKKIKSKIGKVKEIRISINIHNRDYLIKIKKANIFLLEGYNVKITVFFKGREIIFKEKGIELILRFQNNIKGVFFKFSDIEFEGKYIYSIFIPKIKNENKKKKIKINTKKDYN